MAPRQVMDRQGCRFLCQPHAAALQECLGAAEPARSLRRHLRRYHARCVSQATTCSWQTLLKKSAVFLSLSRVNRAGLEQINEQAAAAKVALWQNTYIIVTITLIPICFLVGCLVLVIVFDDTLPTS